MSGKRRATDSVVGVAAIGGVVTGVASLVAALFPFFSGDFAAARVCLLAASLSYGLLGIAVLGK